MVITQLLSKLMLLEEQAVSITDYMGHGPWSCKTVYADASVKLKDDGISVRVLQHARKKGELLPKSDQHWDRNLKVELWEQFMFQGVNGLQVRLVSWQNNSRTADNRGMLFSIFQPGK